MNPVNRIGAKAFFFEDSGKSKSSQEEDLAKALREAKEAFFRAQDDMMGRHQETVKKGLEENKERWREKSGQENLDKIADNRSRYFEARSQEAQKKEKEMNAVLLRGHSRTAEEGARTLEKRAEEEENPSLLIKAGEDRRVAAAEKAEAEGAIQEARRWKEADWLL